MPTDKQRLFLHEEILLLAMRDEEGTTVCGSNYLLAMGGGLAAELWLAHRIGIEASRKKLVDLENSKVFGDEVLDEGIGRLVNAKRRASLQTWVSRFSRLPRLKHRVAEGLCRRGVLREDVGRILLIFSRKIYPERDGRAEKDIITRLRRAIFTGTGQPDPRTTMLLSLAHHADLLKVPFEKRKLKAQRSRIEKLVAGDPIGEAIKSNIQAAQAAAAMVVITPCIVS